MQYEEFKQYVEEHIQAYLPPELAGAEIKVQSVQKNNDRMLQGLYIRLPNEQAVPTLYLEHFYEDYQNTGDIKQVMEHISSEYQKARRDVPLLPTMDKAFVTANVCCQIINAERNEHLLKEMPYRQVMNLAMVPYMRLSECATIKVTKNLLQHVQMSEEEVMQRAVANTHIQLPPTLKSMNDVIADFLEQDRPPLSGEAGMYVLSNDCNQFGAYYMLDKKVMEKVGEVLGNVVILPSSTHEVILVPDSGMDYKDLQDMVCEINQTQVDMEEQLANSVYCYDAQKRELSMPLEGKTYKLNDLSDISQKQGKAEPTVSQTPSKRKPPAR